MAAAAMTSRAKGLERAPALLALLALGLVVFATAWGGIEFTRHYGRVATIWVANAFLLAALLRADRANTPYVLAVGCLANLAANLAAHDRLPLATALAACNAVEVLACAVPLRRWFGGSIDLSRPRELAAFTVFGVLLAPAASGVLAAAALAALGAPFLEVFRDWYLADALGLMVVVPPLLAIPHEDLRSPPRPGAAARVGAALALAALVALGVFGQDRYPLLFLVFPPVVLAAFVTGVTGAALVTLLTAAIAIVLTVAGHGPLALIATDSPAERILVLQAFLAAVVIVAVPVASALAGGRRLAQELCESEARYRLLAENTSDVIILKETFDGARAYVSPSCRAVLGYEPEAMGKIPSSELVHPEDLAEVRAAFGRVSPAQPEVTATYRIRHRDGHWVWVETGFRLAPTADGSRLVLATVHDATAHKRAEAELSAARDQAEAAARAKSEFLAAMSHEIRTPLTAVIGMADLLADKPLDVEAGRYVAAIRGAGQQLLSIVNDILDFLRLGAGRMSLHERDFAPAALLEEIGAILRPAALDKGLALDLPAPADPGPLLGDPVRLRQILFNLVGNAIKFTGTGRIEVRTELVDLADGRVELRCEVRDTGIGIEPDQLPLLFQPFKQVDSSASRRFGGAGLGLAICKQLVEVMGGSIACESRPGAGSVFRFAVVMRRGQGAGTSGVRELPRPVEPLDILLAEDAPLNRQLLADLLGRQGHRLVITEDGAEFLACAGRRRFDVLLVDIQMPVLDGESAVRTLRGRDGPNRKTPALALTANVMEDDRQRYLGAGFDEVLHKPVAPADLYAELARAAAPERRAQGSPAAEPPPGLTAGTPAAVDPPPVDWAFVTAALGGLPPATADEFLKRALADSRAGLEGLREADLDPQARRRLAHRLKGTSRSFGLVGIGDAAAAVEHAACNGRDLREALARYATALDATSDELARRPLVWS